MTIYNAIRRIPMDRITLTGLFAGLALLILLVGSMLTNTNDEFKDGIDISNNTEFLLEPEPIK